MTSTDNLFLSRLHITPLVVIAVVAYIISLACSGFQVSGGLLLHVAAPVPAVLLSLLVFDKWAWKWRCLNSWFSRRPNLCGTWRGELRSSWIDPATGEPISPIPCFAVVRQTFTMLSIRLLTAESQSTLIAERILIANDGVFQIACVYQNEPKTDLRGVRSEIHFGAMLLTVGTSPDRELFGHYWTDRSTKGEIQFRFCTQDVFESFDAAIRCGEANAPAS